MCCQNDKQQWSGLIWFAGLADQALKYLEAQTWEAARLRAHAAGLEGALSMAARQGRQLEEAQRDLAAVQQELAATKTDLEAAWKEAGRQEDDAQLAWGELG